MATEYLLAMGRGAGQNVGVSQTRFWAPCGGQDASTQATEANAQFRVRDTYTWKKLYARVVSNTLDSNSVFTSRKNSGAGGQTLTVASNTTGEFVDNSNSDSLTDGDLICYQIVSGTGPGSLFPILASVLQHSGSTTIIGCYITSGESASGTGIFVPSGLLQSNGTEANRQITFHFASTLSRLQVYISANTRNGAITFRTRKNGGAGSQSVSVTASTTGWFEDASNTDTIADGDEVAFERVTGGSSGSLTVMSITVEATGGRRLAGVASAGFTSTNYLMIEGGATASTTEAQHQVDCVADADFKNLYTYVSANTRDAATTIGLRVAGATVISVSVGAAATGVFEETSTTSSPAVTEAVNYIIAPAAGTGTITVQLVSIEQVVSAVAPADLTLQAIAGIATAAAVLATPALVALGAVAGIAAVTNLQVATPAPVAPDAVAGVATATVVLASPAPILPDAVAGSASLANVEVGTPRVTLQAIAGVAALPNIDLLAPSLITLGTVAGVAAATLEVSTPAFLALGQVDGVAALANIEVQTPAAVVTLQPVAGLASLANLEVATPAAVALGAIAGLAVLANLELASPAPIATNAVAGIATATVVLATPVLVAPNAVAGLSTTGNLVVGTPLVTLQTTAGIAALANITIGSPARVSPDAVAGVATVVLVLAAPAQLTLQPIAGVAFLLLQLTVIYRSRVYLQGRREPTKALSGYRDPTATLTGERDLAPVTLAGERNLDVALAGNRDTDVSLEGER